MLSSALLAAALTIMGPVEADIRETKHNLAKRPGESGLDVDAKEVCVYCHFPRIGDPDAPAPPASGPLWQPSASGGSHIFQIYDDNGRMNLDGADPVGSPSVACLSCHDANQAVDSSKSKREHPFGVPYRGSRQTTLVLDTERAEALRGGLSETFVRVAVDAEDYRPALESRAGGRRIYWTSARDGASRRSKGDLPLFARRVEGGATDVPFIECSSCHDPHTARPLFLRATGTGAELCMTCHQK